MPAIYMSDRSSIRQVGVHQLASAFGVCLGAQKQAPKVCLTQILVLLGRMPAVSSLSLGV